MTKQGYHDLVKALDLLHDYVSQYGASADHYKILDDATDVLKGNVSTGGEI